MKSIPSISIQEHFCHRIQIWETLLYLQIELWQSFCDGKKLLLLARYFWIVIQEEVDCNFINCINTNVIFQDKFLNLTMLSNYRLWQVSYNKQVTPITRLILYFLLISWSLSVLKLYLCTMNKSKWKKLFVMSAILLKYGRKQAKDNNATFIGGGVSSCQTLSKFQLEN